MSFNLFGLCLFSFVCVCFASYFLRCVFVLFHVLFLPVYIAVYFLFVFKFTYRCHQVEIKLQLINIISHHIFTTCQSYFAVQQVVF